MRQDRKERRAGEKGEERRYRKEVEVKRDWAGDSEQVRRDRSERIAETGMMMSPGRTLGLFQIRKGMRDRTKER